MKSKVTHVLLSVAIATVLWLYVITTVSPGSRQTFYNIPVVLANETVLTERGLMITNQSASTVTMELSGNRSDLIKVDSGKITLKADLSAIYEPGTQIPVSYTTGFPGNVASNAFVVESKIPSRIYLTVEYRVSKAVPVEVKWNGSVPDGFIADRENRVLEYPAVQLTGPQSVIEKIEKAVIEVDLTDQRESISQDCTYTLCDAEGEPVDAGLVVTNVDQIHLEVKIQRVKDIALTYVLVEGGGAKAQDVEITMSVDTIRVSGSEAALELMGDTLVLGNINLAEITEDTSLIFTVPLEEGITNLTGVSEVAVNVLLKDLETRDLLVQKIDVVNVPEGLAVELFTKELTLKVRGPAEQVERLTSDDVRVSVDFTDAEIGTSTFRADVSFGEGFGDIGTIKADSVSASVTTVEAQTAQETVAQPEETE